MLGGFFLFIGGWRPADAPSGVLKAVNTKGLCGSARFSGSLIKDSFFWCSQPAQMFRQYKTADADEYQSA